MYDEAPGQSQNSSIQRSAFEHAVGTYHTRLKHSAELCLPLEGQFLVKRLRPESGTDQRRDQSSEVCLMQDEKSSEAPEQIEHVRMEMTIPHVKHERIIRARFVASRHLVGR